MWVQKRACAQRTHDSGGLCFQCMARWGGSHHGSRSSILRRSGGGVPLNLEHLRRLLGGGWVVLKISRQENDREEQSQGKNLRKAGVSGLRGLGSEKAVGDQKRRMRTCSEGLGLNSAASGLQLRVFEKVGGWVLCLVKITLPAL